MRKLIVYLVIALLGSFPAGVTAEPHPEQRLLAALESIRSAELAAAEKQLEGLVAEIPDFKLAQLLYADVLKSRALPVARPGLGIDDKQQLGHLLTEARVRLKDQLREPVISERIPASLSHLDSGYTHALVIDLEASRLYVVENGDLRPRIVDDFYISMGRGGPDKTREGDLKTPLGVYFVESYIPPSKLTDEYGSGAYPINYPNALDVKQGRTGYGIWLHGTHSGTYSRPPLTSEGCVVLPNEDLLSVGSYITLGQTPVIIGEGITWLTIDQWRQQKAVIRSVFDGWKSDWESLDVDSYLSHYSSDFTAGKTGFAGWAAHKRRVSQHKQYIDIATEYLSLLKHPNEDVFVATFRQGYDSNNYRSESWKRQYWKKEPDGQWRIVSESRIDPPVTLVAEAQDL